MLQSFLFIFKFFVVSFRTSHLIVMINNQFLLTPFIPY